MAMNLKDLQMHANHKGYGAGERHNILLYVRLRSRLKDDRDYLRKLRYVYIETQYEWMTDSVVARIAYKGQPLFEMTDPQSDEQFDALVMALKLVD